jgi:hypothetical protein
LVKDEKEFSRQLSWLCGNFDARETLAGRQRKVAESWGVLDGRASARLAELAGRLIDTAPK